MQLICHCCFKKFEGNLESNSYNCFVEGIPCGIHVLCDYCANDVATDTPKGELLNMDEVKRDLEADLKILTIIPPDPSEPVNMISDVVAPHALRRAIAAEARVVEQDTKIAILEGNIRVYKGGIEDQKVELERSRLYENDLIEGTQKDRVRMAEQDKEIQQHIKGIKLIQDAAIDMSLLPQQALNVIHGTATQLLLKIKI